VTPYGNVRSFWLKENGKFFLEVSVAVGTTARVVLPATDDAQISEDGAQIKRSRWIKVLWTRDGEVPLEVSAANCRFQGSPAPADRQ
jgi:hypothetical protein